MGSMSRLLPLLLALAAACSPDGPVEPASFPPCEAESIVSVGEALPDCTFEGLGDADPVTLADLRGKPHVINFWAQWCTACIKEMPDFQQVHTDIGHKVTIVGMDLLGVDGETRAVAEGFALTTGVRYALAYDTDGMLYGHFLNAERPVLPLTVFADAEGIVRHTNFGQMSEQTIRSLISEHLGV